MLVPITLVLLTISLIVVYYYKKAYSYWKLRNVPYMTPKFPFGNKSNLFTTEKNIFLDVADVYHKLKADGHTYGGFYMMTSPNYLAIDPEQIKCILTKDFQHFVNRVTHFSDEDNILSDHLFLLNGHKWKTLRSQLAPTFSPGKIKMMFKNILSCLEPLVQEIGKISDNKDVVDIKELVACAMADVIGSCAFGVECNSFKNPSAEFRRFGRELHTLGFWANTLRLVNTVFPKLGKILNLRKRDAKATEFFIGATKKTVEYREKNNVTRPDFMQLLIQMKNGPEMLTLNEITAQCYVFFVGGFETSSTTLTYCFYELAMHHCIQEKLRIEIKKVLGKHGGAITYADLKEMKYLDQVIDETLRKYPPLPVLNRVCTSDYQFANTNVVIEKGTNVLISNYALHHDPEYFPDPEKFDPDRFSEENRAKIKPYTYLPFGEGPRNCIGLRLGLLQVKMCIVKVLREFCLYVNENTPEKITRYAPHGVTLSNSDVIYLTAERV